MLQRRGKQLASLPAILALALVLALGLVSFGANAISDAPVAAFDAFIQLRGIEGEAGE